MYITFLAAALVIACRKYTIGKLEATMDEHIKRAVLDTHPDQDFEYTKIFLKYNRNTLFSDRIKYIGTVADPPKLVSEYIDSGKFYYSGPIFMIKNEYGRYCRTGVIILGASEDEGKEISQKINYGTRNDPMLMFLGGDQKKYTIGDVERRMIHHIAVAMMDEHTDPDFKYTEIFKKVDHNVIRYVGNIMHLSTDVAVSIIEDDFYYADSITMIKGKDGAYHHVSAIMIGVSDEEGKKVAEDIHFGDLKQTMFYVKEQDKHITVDVTGDFF